MATSNAVPLDYRPKDEADLLRCIADPMWRVCSGALYNIMVKSSDDDEGTVLPFRPNRAQRRLMKRLWHRNIILKARQLGFTTLIAILWLDHALFNADQRCGIIAQDREAAEAIFRDKVKLAYDRLPAPLKAAMPLSRDSATELLFAHNNSSIRVATSMRSGTIHRLHVSEFGKIGAKYPDKAKEVVTGSLPAVPLDGIAIIESTAEGQEGEFYKMTQKARAIADSGVTLSPRDYRFHFFPWWQEQGYRMESAGSAVMTDKDREYFAEVEAKMGAALDPQQRNWYIATRDSEFSGDPEKMWQEYPSTPDEAFQQSTEGCYYSVQLTAARKSGRITAVPHVSGVPVNTFWDIGASDGTAIWFHQEVGAQHRFIRFMEGWGEPYDHFIREMQKLGWVWGVHYLPHDADHKRQQGQTVESPRQMLEKLGIGGRWEIVERVPDVNFGIQLVRAKFGECWFDQEGCKAGVEHLAQYKKTWNSATGTWGAQPRHDIHSEAADAFRQFAQGFKSAAIGAHPVFSNALAQFGNRPASRAGY